MKWHLEISIAQILSKTDKAIFIIDCMWNIDEKIVPKHDNYKCLPSKNLQSPIIFLEQCLSNLNHPDKACQIYYKKNIALKKQIDNEKNKGFKFIFNRQDGCEIKIPKLL